MVLARSQQIRCLFLSRRSVLMRGVRRHYKFSEGRLIKEKAMAHHLTTNLETIF